MVYPTTVKTVTALAILGITLPSHPPIGAAAGQIALGRTAPPGAMVATAPAALRTAELIAQGESLAAPNPVLLAPGAENDDVVVLQRQLQTLGLYQGSLDGRYGPSTQAAISAFQKTAGLEADGVLDQLTWQRMITPQLLTDASEPAAPQAFPSLFPEADPATPTGDVAADIDIPDIPNPDSPPSADGSTSATATPAPRSLGWWGLAGALVLGGSLVSLGVLKRRSASQPPGLETALNEAITELPQAGEPVASLASQQPSLPEGTAFLSQTNSAAPGLELATNQDVSLAVATCGETTRLTPINIVDALVAELRSTEATVRHKAIWELGQRGHSAAIPPLVDGLLDADSQEKSLILAALAEIGHRSLHPMHRALALALQDTSPEVRKNAVRDLSRVYDGIIQLSQMLTHAAQDPHPDVQETAQWALDQLNRIRPSTLPSPPSSPSDSLPPSPP
ncbi:MAG: peptidoglycan-binding protein [Nodosilinea sp.]